MNVILRNAIAVAPGPLISIEGSQRLSFDNALGIAVFRNACYKRITLLHIVHAEASLGKFRHLVGIMRQCKAGVPRKVFRLQGDGIQRKLNATVGNVAHIGRKHRHRIDVCAYGIVPNKVPCLLAVQLYRTIEPTFEESKVKAYVQHARAFPL